MSNLARRAKTRPLTAIPYCVLGTSISEPVVEHNLDKIEGTDTVGYAKVVFCEGAHLFISPVEISFLLPRVPIRARSINDLQYRSSTLPMICFSTVICIASKWRYRKHVVNLT